MRAPSEHGTYQNSVLPATSDVLGFAANEYCYARVDLHNNRDIAPLLLFEGTLYP